MLLLKISTLINFWLCQKNLTWSHSERWKNDTCTLIEELIRPERLFFLESLSPCTVIKDCTFIRDIRVQSALAAVWLNFDQGCVFSVCSRPHTTMKNAEKLKSVSRLFLVQYPLGISPQESDWWLGDTNLIVNNLFPLGHSNLDHATSSKRWRLERFI